MKLKLTRDHLYTVIFMLIVSAVIALVLASANAYYKPMIDQNVLVADRTAVLYVFGLDTGGTSDEILKRYEENVKPDTNAGVNVKRQVGAQGETLALAVPFEGAGLWGRIEGYLGISPDKKTVTGIVFTSQNETPGLGGRIDELAYREQFRGLKIEAGSPLAYGSAGGDQIDAISGATQTSNAVLRMINTLIDNTISRLEVK